MLGTNLLRTAAGCALALQMALSPAFAAEQGRTHYRSPTAAVDGLLEAARAKDPKALIAVFGPESSELLSSGDEVMDQDAKRRFLERADLRTSLDREADNRVVLSFGEDDWPFPIPLLKGDAGWYFDTEEGANELINRRIGRNELNTIAVAHSYISAQNEYYDLAPQGEGAKQYAQRFLSSEGKRDGLYWPVAEAEPESPLGPLVASAAGEGYQKAADDSTRPRPYHGYLFRILTAQGKNAAGGERNYLTDRGMTEGYALLAYPVEYADSGIMSFMVNHRGLLFQKDLGKETAQIAEGIKVFDPDASWEPVKE
jgi:hypothetical protein